MDWLKLWTAFLASPVEFFTGMFAIGVLITGVVLWVLREQFATLNARIEARDETIAKLEKQIADMEAGARPSPVAPASRAGKTGTDPKGRTFFDAADGGHIKAQDAEIDASAGALFTQAFAKSDGAGSLIDMSGVKVVRQPPDEKP